MHSGVIVNMGGRCRLYEASAEDLKPDFGLNWRELKCKVYRSRRTTNDAADICDAAVIAAARQDNCTQHAISVTAPRASVASRQLCVYCVTIWSNH